MLSAKVHFIFYLFQVIMLFMNYILTSSIVPFKATYKGFLFFIRGVAGHLQL